MANDDKGNQSKKEAIYIERLQARRSSIKLTESFRQKQQMMKSRNEAESTYSESRESSEGGEKKYGSRVKLIRQQLESLQKGCSEEASRGPSAPGSRRSSHSVQSIKSLQSPPSYSKPTTPSIIKKNNHEKHNENVGSSSSYVYTRNIDDIPKVSFSQIYNSVNDDDNSLSIKNEVVNSECPFDSAVPSESEFFNGLLVIERRGPDERRDSIFCPLQTSTLTRNSRETLPSPIQAPDADLSMNNSQVPDVVSPNDTMSSNKTLPDLVPQPEIAPSLNIEQRRFLNSMLSLGSDCTPTVSEITSPTFSPVSPSVNNSYTTGAVANSNSNPDKEITTASCSAKPNLSDVSERTCEDLDNSTEGGEGKQSGNEADLEDEFEKNSKTLEQNGPTEFFKVKMLETEASITYPRLSSRLSNKVVPLPPTIIEEADNYKSADENTGKEEEGSECGKSLTDEDMTNLDDVINKLNEDEKPETPGETEITETPKISRTRVINESADDDSKNEKNGITFGAGESEDCPQPAPRQGSKGTEVIKPQGGADGENKQNMIRRLSGIVGSLTKKKQTVKQSKNGHNVSSETQSPVSPIDSTIPNTNANASSNFSAEKTPPENCISSVKPAPRASMQKKKKQPSLETPEPRELKDLSHNALGAENEITKVPNPASGVENLTPSATNDNCNSRNDDNNNFTLNEDECDGVENKTEKTAENSACELIGDVFLPEKPSRKTSRLKALSQSLRRKFFKKTEPTAKLEPPIVEARSSDDEKLRILKEQKKIQEALIQQASKAVAVCCSMAEFITSRERAESERALLLSQLRDSSYELEITRLKMKSKNGRSSTPSPIFMDNKANIVGAIDIKSVKLQLRDTIVKGFRPDGRSVEWFVIVVNEGQRFCASECLLMTGNEEWLNFKDHIVVTNLKDGYKLTLRVYSMSLRENIEFDDQERYHLPADSNTSWFSPNELLRDSILRRSRKAAMQRAKMEVTASASQPSSSFRECGEIEITSELLKSPLPWTLEKVPNSSSINGTIVAQVDCSDLQLNVSLSGLLNYGKGQLNGSIDWKMYFCTFENHILSFWKDPKDVDKPPLFTIDLIHCTTRTIQRAEESECMRRWTLVINAGRERTPEDQQMRHVKFCKDVKTLVVKHLLSFNEKNQYELWQGKLCFVATNIHDWSRNVVYE